MNEKNEKRDNEPSFLFDTYAILEIIGGNINYNFYLDSTIIINDFIFAELCYNLLQTDKLKVEEYAKKYAPYIFQVEPEWIIEAMGFRIEWKDRGVSMTDCISYIMSKKLGIKFLTGDKEFENLENVEFVK